MPELFPLAALRDPVAFLAVARIPLAPRSGDGRWECVNGTIYQDIAGSLEAAEEYDEAADQSVPSRAALAALALDLADPDVARWCDRKIAESYGFPEVIAAVLCIFDGQWCVHLMGVAYPSSVDARLDAAFEGIPCDAAHIPTARAALLRVLFGRTP